MECSRLMIMMFRFCAGVSPLQMDSPSCETYQLSFLFRQSQRAVAKNGCNVHDCVKVRRGFPSYLLCMYYFPSIYFLSLISESCYHFSLPLIMTLRNQARPQTHRIKIVFWLRSCFCLFCFFATTWKYWPNE